MLKILGELFQKYALPLGAKYIENNKDKWVKEINDDNDIPWLSEKDEKKILDAFFNFIINKMKQENDKSSIS
mgnify:FL=1